VSIPDDAHPLDALYRSEINFSLETFWDAGWRWAVGGVPQLAHHPGFLGCAPVESGLIDGDRDRYHTALIQMCDAAAKAYPASDFASWWPKQRKHYERLTAQR
jgi:hypothetical protein